MPEGPFCLSCTFIFRNERNWMKKSARVSEKPVSPGLPGLQVATGAPANCCKRKHDISFSEFLKSTRRPQTRCSVSPWEVLESLKATFLSCDYLRCTTPRHDRARFRTNYSVGYRTKKDVTCYVVQFSTITFPYHLII